MSNKSKIVFVAMSGGVDSSVAAFLLKQEGHDVTGVHMICADFDLAKQDNEIEHPRFAKRIGIGICEQAQEDRRDAMRAAAHIGIPFLVWDFRKEYKEAVFDYMVSEYRAGRTPNPDVMCNKHIKFGVFLKRALEVGADYIATGHYVRLRRPLTIDNQQLTNSNGQMSNVKCQMSAAIDSTKDQSYFLWTLTQDQLKHCLFPIGDYLKSEVRKIALEAGLPVAEKKDSQGLCFVGKIDFRDFMREILPKREGAVVDSAGEVLGQHDGAHFYTVGQRHGLNIGGMPQPLYVAERNISTNTLVVAQNDSDPILYRQELIAENLNWILGNAPKFPLKCLARIRYRQLLRKCTVELEAGSRKLVAGSLKVTFNEPQRAVAPGQSVVFYLPADSAFEASAKEAASAKEGRAGEMLGGGIIK